MSNFHTKEWILSYLNTHYEDAKKVVGEDKIFGVFYQGSGNYGLDYEGSDVDSFCVTIPPDETSRDNSTRHHTWARCGGLIKFFNFNIFCKELLGGHWLSMECLYTPYFVINPAYQSVWDKMMTFRDAIAKDSTMGLVKNIRNDLNARCEAIHHCKYDHDASPTKWGKPLCRMLRNQERLTRLINGETWGKTMLPTDTDSLMKIRMGGISCEDAIIKSDLIIKEVDALLNCIPQSQPKRDPEIRESLGSLVKELLSIYNELHGEE